MENRIFFFSYEISVLCRYVYDAKLPSQLVKMKKMSHLDVVLYPPDFHCMDWNVLQYMCFAEIKIIQNAEVIYNKVLKVQ